MPPSSTSTRRHGADSNETEPLLSSWEPGQDDDATSQPHAASPEEAIQTSVVLRITAATFSFIMLGLISSSVGVMIPQLEEYYDLTHTHVSLIFVTFPTGYLLAAYLNSHIHQRFGQRGVSIIGPISHLIFTVVASTHPPFPLFLVASALGAFGGGLLDGSWSAWVGGMQNVNAVQGILHGGFSTGASLGPFLAGTLLTQGHNPWYTWYHVLAGASLFEIVLLIFAFRFEDAKKYQAEKEQHDDVNDITEDRWIIFKHPVTWICAAYFLSYVGTEAAISGWIVGFMQRERHADPYLASICSSLFWIGMTVGRLTLGFVTDRVGVRIATLAYLVAAVVLQGLFAAVEIPEASAVLVWFIGYFFGPLFPSGLVMMTRLLPKSLHIRAVAFVVALGQVGGACIPFGLGALADVLGLQVFQFIILIWLVVTLAAWLLFPRLPKLEKQTEEDGIADGPAGEHI